MASNVYSRVFVALFFLAARCSIQPTVASVLSELSNSFSTFFVLPSCLQAISWFPVRAHRCLPRRPAACRCQQPLPLSLRPAARTPKRNAGPSQAKTRFSWSLHPKDSRTCFRSTPSTCGRFQPSACEPSKKKQQTRILRRFAFWVTPFWTIPLLYLAPHFLFSISGTLQRAGVCDLDEDDASTNLGRALDLGSETAAINSFCTGESGRARLQLAVGGPLLVLHGTSGWGLSPQLIAWVKRAVQSVEHHSMALAVRSRLQRTCVTLCLTFVFSLCR
jgi:hypothetical protein